MDLTCLQYKLHKILKIYFVKNCVKVPDKDSPVDLVHHLVLEGGDQPVHQHQKGKVAQQENLLFTSQKDASQQGRTQLMF